MTGFAPFTASFNTSSIRPSSIVTSSEVLRPFTSCVRMTAPRATISVSATRLHARATCPRWFRLRRRETAFSGERVGRRCPQRNLACPFPLGPRSVRGRPNRCRRMIAFLRYPLMVLRFARLKAYSPRIGVRRGSSACQGPNVPCVVILLAGLDSSVPLRTSRRHHHRDHASRDRESRTLRGSLALSRGTISSRAARETIRSTVSRAEFGAEERVLAASGGDTLPGERSASPSGERFALPPGHHRAVC